jgi:hypothetical protein
VASRLAFRVTATLGLLLWVGVAVAQDLPAPLCGGGAPEFAAVGENPIVRVWTGQEVPVWSPPPCTGWDAGQFLVAVEALGRFADAAGIDGVLARIAAISEYAEILYWSHTRRLWRPLVPEATALGSADPADHRGDFRLDELAAGARVYLWQRENTPAGEVVYRMEVLARTPDHLLLTLENANELTARGIPLLDPGGWQVMYAVERETGDVWRYYALARSAVPDNPLVRLLWPLLADGEASYANRTAAMFRFHAGIPTDREPPLAP